MASPEILLTFLAVGLVLNSRRTARIYYGRETSSQDGSANVLLNQEEIASDIDAVRRLRPEENYRAVTTFTSLYYDIS
ncbi:hypothetical protein ACXR0O_15320 [Verrucomicrobiota bacterium sgz303538]